MVAVSLPFWMNATHRTMLPFQADRAPRGGTPPAASRARPPSASPGAVLVERCTAAAMDAHAQAWAALADRALEPNVFMEPGFALPAAKLFPAAERPDFLLCWHTGSEAAPRLVGLLALQPGRAPLSPAVAAAWLAPLWVTGAPLLDRGHAQVALDAMLGWLSGQRRFRSGLLVRGIAAEGPLRAALGDGGRRDTVVLSTEVRAVLRHDGGPDAAGGPGGKRAKELRRQWRRLGDASLSSARSPEEVRHATEQFLALEARGWKGRAGTALLLTPHLATFTRAMTRLLASQGLCRIDTLTVEGVPVAMGIVLRSGSRAYFWKTAYDESRRQQSPGKQLALAIGQAQAKDPGLVLTDSCAVPDHPMIDHLWAGRMEVVDVLVGGPGDGSARLERAAARLRRLKAVRAGAKAAFHAAKRLLRRG